MTNAELSKILNEQKGEHFGDFVWWSLHGVGEVSLIMAAGSWPSSLPDLLPKQKFSRAWRHALNKAGKELRARNLLVRPNIRREKKQVILLVHEDRDQRRETNDYDIACKLSIDFDTGNVDVDPPNEPSGNEIVQHYRRLAGKLVANDFVGINVKVMQYLGAVPVRRMGGVYFVPAANSETLREYQQWVQQFGAEFSLVPQYRTPDGEREVGRAAERTFIDDLMDLERDIKRWSEKTRHKTMENRMSELDELRRRASFYRGIADQLVEDMEKKIKYLEGAVLQLLGLHENDRRNEIEMTVSQIFGGTK